MLFLFTSNLVISLYANPPQSAADTFPSLSLVSSVSAQAPQPLMIGLLIIELVFGLVFIIVGSINVKKCNIDPMIPIWLILMGKCIS